MNLEKPKRLIIWNGLIVLYQYLHRICCHVILQIGNSRFKEKNIETFLSLNCEGQIQPKIKDQHLYTTIKRSLYFCHQNVVHVYFYLLMTFSLGQLSLPAVC